MANGMTRRERQITDPAEIRYILEKSLVVHIAMIDGDEPYVVPMNYGYTLTDNGPTSNGRLTLYLHGATQGRKIDAMRANPKVFFSLECDLEPFAGDVACRYGMAYSSLMGKGNAVILDDPAEKMAAMSTLMKTQTGGDFTFDEKLVKVVSVIRIDVEEYTAKKRSKPERCE